MEIRRFDDTEAFFAHAAPFLEAREPEHNLILGMRNRLLRDKHAFGEQDPYLAVAEDDGTVVGVGWLTPPYTFGLSAIDDLAVVDAFVADARALDLPGVVGPVEAAERFASLWTELRGMRAQIGVAERIYAATEAFPPLGVPGRMRPYQPSDHDSAAAWMDAFIAEALGEMPIDRHEDGAAFVARRAADPDGELMIWEHEGEPVSMAGYGSPTPNGLRVGPVYTPPELRGRGYASALVGELTARLLAGGRRFCFLYTDLSNPTSNSIYQRVGYRAVSDVSLWRFEPT